MSVGRLRAGSSRNDRFRRSASVPRAIIIFVAATLLAVGTVGRAQDVPVRLPDATDDDLIAQFTAQHQHRQPAAGTLSRENRTCDPWYWQVLPEGLIYRSYLAGAKEPRIGSQWVYDYQKRWLWEVTLGGRVGILRYGNDDVIRPQGWQIDLEGAAFPRLDMQKHPNAEHSNDLVSDDFRVGFPVTYGWGRWQTKMGYYHISSHLGDELMLRDPDFRRINYSRDSIVFGQSYYCTDDLRLYGEAACAISPSGGALPWELGPGPPPPGGRRLGRAVRGRARRTRAEPGGSRFEPALLTRK